MELNYLDGKGQCGRTIDAMIYLKLLMPLEKVNIQVGRDNENNDLAGNQSGHPCHRVPAL